MGTRTYTESRQSRKGHRKFSLDYLAQHLSPESFVRIHRSRIPNLEAVEAFERHDDKRVRPRLKSGTTVVASRAWSSALRGQAT